MLNHSLALRLTIFFSAAILFVISCIFGVVSEAIDEHHLKQDEQLLEYNVGALQSLYANNKTDYLKKIAAEVARNAGLEIRIEDQHNVVYGETIAHPIEQVSELMKVFHWSNGTTEFLAMRFEMADINSQRPILQATLSVNINQHQALSNVFREMLIKFTLTVGAASALLGWLVTRQGLLPLAKLTKKASSISTKHLSERMPTENLPVEIRSLSCTLNEMLQRLEVAITHLSDFSSDIAHELRTPVNNLMTQTQVCLSQPRKKEEYIDILASNAEEYQRLSRMITDMLFLAKSDNQGLILDKEKLSVEQEINELFEFYEALAEECKVTLLLTGKADFSGDKLMLRRAFSNLLSNAIRHSFSNSEIIVQLKEQSGQVVVSIENKGETISVKDIPHLFKRFYRADKSRTHGKHEGVGLGLAITKSIVELHNGTISVVSENNATKFTLSF
jgi:two-component system heavy metal sensor histidine kinase CusS